MSPLLENEPGAEDLESDVESDELAQLLIAANEVENSENLQKAKVPRLRDDATFARELTNMSSQLHDIECPAPSKSLIQNNDFDSSDEEDVKNFLDQKYNEYGRDINKKLKQDNNEKHESKVAREVNTSITRSFSQALQKSVANGKKNENQLSQNFTAKPKPSPVPANKPEPLGTIHSDPVFGMRLVRPLVSGAVLKERMEGRTPVTMSGVAFHTERGDLSKDWVIAGAIISKSPVKTTKKGDSFSIWKLSDLKGEIKMVSLFLFKSAHKDLWKTAIGVVVAILNPGVLEKREQRGDVACLSVDNPQKVMILGESKDFGTCKSKKKNGELCGSIVNLTDCEFCVYHVKQEFGKMSKRSELQSSTAGRGLHDLRNKILGKSEVFYAGQSFTAVPAKKSAKLAAKDKHRMMTLSEYYQSPNAGNVNHVSQPKSNKEIPYANRNGATMKKAQTMELNNKQRLKDLDRLKLLKNDERIAEEPKSQIQTNVPEKYQNREFSFIGTTPTLTQAGFTFELNLGKRKADYSKQKAIAAIKKNPLEKIDPNFVKYRGTIQGKKRAIDELHNLTESTAKKQKRDEDEKKSRIQKIIDATSSHTNLIQSREDEEREKYFNKLERKEALEEKMLVTFSVPCKAVICQKCKYTAFSAADRCKEERHPLKVIDAEKRFFQCEDCGNRTSTVHKMPKLSCKNCSGSRWKRSAMIRERSIHDGGAKLSIRGDEEMFHGSITGGANLNLLVPDE